MRNKVIMILAVLLSSIAFGQTPNVGSLNGLKYDSSHFILGNLTQSGGTLSIINSWGFPLDSSGNLLIDCATGCGGGAGNPGGTTGQLQYNNGGVFGGFADGTAHQVLHGVRTFSAVTSLDVDTSIAQTGVDINTSFQVTALHLAAPLGTAAGGTGAASLAAANIALTTATLAQFAATTSAQLAGVISDETGTGLVMFSTNPLMPGYHDVTEIAAPANPGAGNQRWYANSSTHVMSCLTSAGASCAPSGGAGTVTTSGTPAANQIALFSSSTAITGTATDTTTTHALFATATVPAFRAIAAGDIPTLNQSTTGTASNLSGTPALPNGTTATTQSVADNTTKIATDAFVLANAVTNPLTTLGDVPYGGASGVLTRLAGPTGVNGVPQFPQETPAAGAATALVFAPSGVVPNAQTGTTYTVLATDRAGYVSFSNAASIAVTLPQAGTTGFASNFVFVGCDIGAGTATITPTTSTISYTTGSAYTSAASTLALTTGQCAWIYSDNTNYFAIVRGAGAGTVTTSGGPASPNLAAFSSASAITNATGHNVAVPLVCADTSASGTAQVCNTAPTFTPASGDCINYTTTTANTGAGLTWNVNSLGAKSVEKWLSSTTLVAGDIPANKTVKACYNGTSWDVMTIGNAPSGSGSSVSVNGGATVTSPNLNAATPAAVTGATNVTWQQSTNSVSAYTVPTANVTAVNNCGFVAPIGTCWAVGLSANLATQFSATNVPQVMQFVLPYSTQVTKISYNLGTIGTAAATCDVGLYSAGTLLVHTGSFTCGTGGTTGVATVSVTTTQAPAGIYYLAWCAGQASGTLPKFEGVSYANSIGQGLPQTTGETGIAGTTNGACVAGVLPASLGTVTNNTGGNGFAAYFGP